MLPSDGDLIDTLKNSLPPSYASYLMVVTENGYFENEELTANDFIQNLEERVFDLQCHDSSEVNQNPTLYVCANHVIKSAPTSTPITSYYSQITQDIPKRIVPEPNVFSSSTASNDV